MPFLEVSQVIAGYGTEPVIRSVSMDLEKGTFLGIIGPNGSGKTTLLRVIGRVLAPASGSVLISGTDIYQMDQKETARIIATVPQETPITFGFAVRDVVMMGRLPHLKRFSAEQPHDIDAVDTAIEMAGIEDLAARSIADLSGGEKQKVIIAQALAQEPELLLLDEPTSHLDISHQLELLTVIKKLNEDGMAAVGVFHDLNMAAQYCDRLVLMTSGEIKASGRPDEVLTRENLEDYFNVTAVVEKNGDGHVTVSAYKVGNA